VQRLVVTGRDSGGSAVDVTDQARFRLIRPGIARLDPNRVLLPLENGSTEVIAQVGTLTAHTPVMVVNAHKLSPGSLANDIEPVFTKIGCNQGSCHGQQNGKGGFKLSLRGYDPALDLEQMVKAENGKRINAKEPEKSLLLLKPTMQVPHGGGPRLTK